MATLNKKINIVPYKDGGTNSLKDEIQNYFNSLGDNLRNHIKILDESKLAIEQTQKKLEMELNTNLSIQNSDDILNLIKKMEDDFKNEKEKLMEEIKELNSARDKLKNKNVELESKIIALENLIKSHKCNGLILNKEPEIKSPIDINRKNHNIKITPVNESKSVTIHSGINSIALQIDNNNNNISIPKHLISPLNKESIEEEKQDFLSQGSSSCNNSSICTFKENNCLNFSNFIKEKDKVLLYKSIKTNKFIRINLYDNNDNNPIYHIADINQNDIFNNNHFIYIGEIKKIHVGAIDHNIGSISNNSSYHDYDIGIKTNASGNFAKIEVINMMPLDITYDKIVNNININNNINNNYYYDSSSNGRLIRNKLSRTNSTSSSRTLQKVKILSDKEVSNSDV